MTYENGFWDPDDDQQEPLGEEPRSDEPDPAKTAEIKDARTILIATMLKDKKTRREAILLAYLFGVGGTPWTLEQIAREWARSDGKDWSVRETRRRYKDRVRQLSARVIAIARKIVKQRGLELPGE